MFTRTSCGRSSMAKNITIDAMNASTTRPVAIHPAAGSPMRLPNSSSTTAPSSGNAGTIQIRSRRSRALIFVRSRCFASAPPSANSGHASLRAGPSAKEKAGSRPPRSRGWVLEEVEVVGGCTATTTEDGDDDAESDRDLGGRDRQHEEHDHLAANVVERAGERHEREVHRVEHELDAHEHHQHVAPGEEADRADGEEQRGEHEVVVGGDVERGERQGHGASSMTTSSAWRLRRASTTAPITESTSSAAVISNGHRKSVNSDRATRATLLPSPGVPPWMASVAGALAPVAHL